MTTSTSPNPYIIRKLNNMDKDILLKKKHYDWIQLYHKTLKELEVIINIQRQVKDMMKIAEKMNMTITEMEETILKVSINNRMTNITNILGISEDL